MELWKRKYAALLERSASFLRPGPAGSTRPAPWQPSSLSIARCTKKLMYRELLVREMYKENTRYAQPLTGFYR